MISDGGDTLMTDIELLHYLGLPRNKLRSVSAGEPTLQPVQIGGRSFFRVSDVARATGGTVDVNRPLITVRAVMSLCGVSAPTVALWRAKPHGPRCVRLFGCWLYRYDDVERFREQYDKRARNPKRMMVSGEEFLSERMTAAYLHVSLNDLRKAPGNALAVTVIDGKPMYRVADIGSFTGAHVDLSRPLLNGVEVERCCRVSHTTLWLWRRTGKGPRVIRIGARYRYHPDDVDVFVSSYHPQKR